MKRLELSMDNCYIFLSVVWITINMYKQYFFDLF